MNDLRFVKIETNNHKEWFDNKLAAEKTVFFNKDKARMNTQETKRLKRVTNLKPFGDADKDKIPNFLDNRPFIKDKKSKWSLLR